MKQFGENIEGFTIPVLNEREIRAAAGIYFFILFIAIGLIIANENYVLIKYFVISFLADFVIRLFIGPKYSPSLIMGRWIVRNQQPEYVGAPQKKYAWTIGLFLSAGIFVHLVVFNATSILLGLICLTCFIFLFFETAFGICLGCKVYNRIKKDKAQYCPGEVCAKEDRHEIQKISTAQLFVTIGLIASIILIAFLFNSSFSQPPVDLLSNT